MTMFDSIAANHSVDASGRVLTVTATNYAACCSQAMGDPKSAGKWYYELVLTSVANALNVFAGLSQINCTTYPGQASGTYGYHGIQLPQYNFFAQTIVAGSSSNFGPNFESGTVIGIAVDLDTGRGYVSTNGLWRRYNSTTYGAAEPDLGNDIAFYLGGPIWPAVGAGYAGDIVTANFAASDLIYDPPDGFAAWYAPEPVAVRALLDQSWSIKVGATLFQPWGDAPVSRSLLHQPWGDAAAVRSLLHQPWADALAARGLLQQPWGIMDQTRAVLNQPWAITAEAARAILRQGWNIEDINPVRSLLDQPWAIATGDGESVYNVVVRLDGEQVLCDLINIEGDLDEDSLSCELQLAREAEYIRCQDGMEIAIEVTSTGPTETFLFKVSAMRIVENPGSTQYIIEGLSQGAFLGPPYGESYRGDLGGMVADIAVELVGQVDWQTVDWELPPALLNGSGQTRLELLKQPTRAVRAVVQSEMDGSLYVQPEYSIPVNQWASATPDKLLVETLDCFTVGSTFEHRLGANRFLVGDQVTSGERTTPELTDLRPGLKEARAYQVPFVGDLRLIHTGGPWASITYIGVEERTVPETVEFVGGAGQTKFPIYNSPQIQWLQNDLGAVTESESGALTAQEAGQSLAKVTYKTKCMLWHVRDLQAEQLQLVWDK